MMGRRKVAIGVDIGGTKISAGIVGGEGLVYASPRTIATNPKEPGEVNYCQFVFSVEKYSG